MKRDAGLEVGCLPAAFASSSRIGAPRLHECIHALYSSSATFMRARLGFCPALSSFGLERRKERGELDANHRTRHTRAVVKEGEKCESRTLPANVIWNVSCKNFIGGETPS